MVVVWPHQVGSQCQGTSVRVPRRHSISGNSRSQGNRQSFPHWHVMRLHIADANNHLRHMVLQQSSMPYVIHRLPLIQVVPVQNYLWGLQRAEENIFELPSSAAIEYLSPAVVLANHVCGVTIEGRAGALSLENDDSQADNIDHWKMRERWWMVWTALRTVAFAAFLTIDSRVTSILVLHSYSAQINYIKLTLN